jgi:alkaline phosphatase
MPVSIISEGVTEYKIIRPDKPDDIILSAAIGLRTNLSEATGVSVGIGTDWHKKDETSPERAREIVIGRCDRPGIEDIAKELREKDFAIVYKNERIFIIGGGPEATAFGVDYFCNRYVDAESKSVIVPDNLYYISRFEYPLGIVSIGGVRLSEYRIVIPEDCGLYTVAAAENLADYFYYNNGISLDIVKDTEAPSQYEILIGSTNRPESVTASAVSLAPDQYILAGSGTKVIMTGNSYMVGGGVSEFINNYAASRGVNVDFDIAGLPTSYTASSFTFKEARNALLLIGDGMGFNHVEATLAAGLPAFVARELPNCGTATTYSYSVTLGSAAYTDSAAAATALACANKTLNGYVGVNKAGKSLRNIRELAASIGAKSAILTTDVITGATPGGFLVHVGSRSSTDEIKAQIDALVASHAVDFAVGGIGDKLVSEARHELWTISANGSRFFSMIEEGYIDKESHDNDLTGAIYTVRRYNDLIAYAVEFTLCHPDTALIVTADHETGTLTYNNASGKYEFKTTTHSNRDVPVYAIGFGTEFFKDKKVDNTDIAKFMGKIYGDSSFGS